MDTTLLAAAIGAIGGAIATGVGSLLRGRTTERTAARLVYAELVRNSAAVAYYRQTASWPATATNRKAWDTYGETLARVRRSALFEGVHRGYAALEALAYIAGDHTISKDHVERLVEENIRSVLDALRLVGERAQVQPKQLSAELHRLELAPSAESQFMLMDAPPSLLSQLVDIQVAVGQAPRSVLGHPSPSNVPLALGADHRLDLSGAVLRIYDAKGAEDIDPTRLTLVRTEHGPAAADVTVEEVYDGLAHTYAFYREIFQRNSLDGVGGPIEAVVHYGEGYDNLFWDGQRLVVGDGDGVLFQRFSQLDVVAHELSHVLVEEARLRFEGQTGAIVESVCDVLGVLVKQWSRRETVEEADWLVGAGVLAPKIAGRALRSLSAPGTAYNDSFLGADPQPAHMSKYVRTQSDNGGVHINSGIPSRAFYLVATTLGGSAWEQAGKIWYHALTSKVLRPAVTFAGFAGLTVAVARRDFGVRDEVAAAVEHAWREVGVTPRIGKRAAELAAGESPN